VRPLAALAGDALAALLVGHNPTPVAFKTAVGSVHRSAPVAAVGHRTGGIPQPMLCTDAAPVGTPHRPFTTAVSPVIRPAPPQALPIAPYPRPVDRTLGVIEFAAVLVTLAVSVRALRRPSRRRALTATLLAAVCGMTVAQPFGITTDELDAPADDLPIIAEHTDGPPTGVHTMWVAGVLPVPVVLYQRGDVLAGLSENTPTKSLRARSWLWPGVLTNASEVAATCSNDIFTPCPGGAVVTRLHRDGHHLVVTITNPYAEGHDPDTVPDVFRYRLGFGITSITGVVYWLLAAAVTAAAWSRTRAARRITAA
jgi:hypothetical protein